MNSAETPDNVTVAASSASIVTLGGATQRWYRQTGTSRHNRLSRAATLRPNENNSRTIKRHPSAEASFAGPTTGDDSNFVLMTAAEVAGFPQAMQTFGMGKLPSHRPLGIITTGIFPPTIRHQTVPFRDSDYVPALIIMHCVVGSSISFSRVCSVNSLNASRTPCRIE